MSTYAVIGWNDTLVKRGAYTEAKCLADKFPDYIKTYDCNTNIDIDDIRSNSKRVIFTYQNPERYRSRNLLNPKYYNIDIQYIRKNYFTFYKYKTTNGFSTYRENPFYINYVPMMIPMFEPMKTNYNKIVIGYYLRPSYRPDDFKMFIQFVKDLDIDGSILIKELDLKPGKVLGDILNYLLEKVLDDKNLNSKDKLINLSKSYLNNLNDSH